MSDVQRYGVSEGGNTLMEESYGGDWVTFADYVDLQENYEDIAEQHEQLKKMYSELADKIGAIWRDA